MGRSAQPGVHHDRDGRLLDDDLDRVAGSHALVRTDPGSERHHGRAPHLLQPFGQDGVGVDVRENGETLLDKGFSRPKGLHRVGQQVARLRGDLQLYPGGQPCGSGKPGQPDRFLGVDCPARVGKQEISVGVDELEYVRPSRRFQVDPAKRDGDHLRSRGLERATHDLEGAELPRADDEPGRERPPGDRQEIWTVPVGTFGGRSLFGGDVRSLPSPALPGSGSAGRRRWERSVRSPSRPLSPVAPSSPVVPHRLYEGPFQARRHGTLGAMTRFR